jgi:hypothetical protein
MREGRRSGSYSSVIRVYDDDDNVNETHPHDPHILANADDELGEGVVGE